MNHTIMKRTVIILLMMLLASSAINAQNDLSKLNGYKIVIIPYEFSELVSDLSQKFQDIGFKVYTDQSGINGDVELKNDPGIALRCEVSHSYAYPHTTMGIKLINAKSEIVFQKVENSKGKKFVSFNLVDDQRWVLDKIFESFKSYKYSFDISKSLAGTLPPVEKTDWTEESIKSYIASSNIDQIEGIYKSYQNENLGYYKFGVVTSGETYKAVVLESDVPYWSPGEVKAIFEKSSMRGFYSVRWSMANKTAQETFGSMDNDAILTIELKDQSTGKKTQEKFIKVFPTETTQFSISEKPSKASGSGFFISSNGLVGTNAHVIEGSSRIEVSISNELGDFTYKAKVVMKDQQNDVAILQIDDETFTGLNALPYAFVVKSDVGERVFTIGFPLNTVMGTKYKVTDGIISSSTGVSDDIRYYQISVPIQPGNSGGPLFNDDGNIIGLTTSKLNSEAVGTQVENVNYAIKISYLINLYNMLPESPVLPGNSELKGKDLQSKVKVLKNYVCIIRTY